MSTDRRRRGRPPLAEHQRRQIWRRAGWLLPLATIARQMGLARNTVKKYLRPDLARREPSEC